MSDQPPLEFSNVEPIELQTEMEQSYLIYALSTITGRVMGQYHPHGNQAIYDALVRMAQPFSLRHPLIDFHGNYGSPEFEAAAERYTESRLANLAMELLGEID